MANLLQNMLTLQTEYRVPMRMDLSTHSLITYYQNLTGKFENSLEKERLLAQVIHDLKEREQINCNITVD